MGKIIGAVVCIVFVAFLGFAILPTLLGMLWAIFVNAFFGALIGFWIGSGLRIVKGGGGGVSGAKAGSLIGLTIGALASLVGGLLTVAWLERVGLASPLIRRAQPSGQGGGVWNIEH